MYEKFVPGDERVVSYLPLSHIAAQVCVDCLFITIQQPIFIVSIFRLKYCLVVIVV